ncbi:MAG: hypothetical protein JWN93_420 [Hyphomicrobiales bacterium]|nr:hypothetical protein [Hyphomicrobiales bacterium]
MALATALPTAIVEPGKTFAIAGNWGNYNSNQRGEFGAYNPQGYSSIGFNAVGVGGATRLTDGLQINAAVSVGISGRTGASRVGSW